MIKEFSISFSRTINLGNFASARVEASVTHIVSEVCDYETEKNAAQKELRQLLEETYKYQYTDRQKNGTASNVTSKS